MKETQNLRLNLISSSESDVNIHDYIDKTTGDSPDSSLAKIDAAFGTVVLKEEGKGLSPEEFTQEEKAKLAKVAEEANKTIVDSALSPASENPVQNKVVQKALDGKADLGTDGKVLEEQLPDLNYDPVGSAGAVQGNLNAHTGDGDKHFTPGEKEKLSTAAPLDSPSFTGTPTVPSPAVADNSTAIASTAFVKGQGYQTEEQVRGIVGELEYDPAGSAQAVQGNLDAHTANSSSHITAGERTAWNGKASPSAQVDATLLTYEWAGSGPYTQTVAVSELGAAQNGMIGLAQSATQAQREAARDAMLSVTAQASGSLTVTADGDKPGVNIPVTITRLG